jgi:hypothetical protein
MAEFIDNPFKELWNSFDISNFKNKVCSMVDAMALVKNEDELKDILESMDSLIMSYATIVKMKSAESIEIIKVNELPPEIIEELGFNEVDMVDGYIPKELIPEEYINIVEDFANKKKKNNWLI